MSFTGGTSKSSKYVCADCIGEFVVTAEIEAGGRRRECSYCKEVGRAVAIELLADRVEEVYPEMVSEVETTPYFPSDSDKVEYRQNGDTPNTILSEMLECADDEIADDLVSELSSRHGYAAMKDGENDIYDDCNDIYTSYIPRSKEVAQTWASFCESIKHDRRFFNDTASDLLAEILEPILHPKLPGTKSAVRTIEPNSDERFIFRGRLANTGQARSDILAKPINMLGAPPKHLNAGGRMNAAGIPVFYGSFDVKTCVAELRGPVGGTAVVGKFEMLRPLRVLDLTLLQNAMFNISYFDPDVIQKFSYNHFLRGFHKEIKRAVIPGSETLDYLPTQFVAEYLWTKAEPPLDGLFFGSAQISNAKAKNIAIFPHASVAEGWYEELHPKKPASTKQRAETSARFSDFIESVNFDFETVVTKEQVPDASLRLVKDATVIADVRSIDYTLKTWSVSTYEMDMEYSSWEDDYKEEEEEEE